MDNKKPTNMDDKTPTKLDIAERIFDNVLRLAWLVFIIKIVFYGY